MISEISFKNYKVFKEKQTIDLKPITILIGKNNTGKSAVLKLMSLIDGALNSKENHPFKLENGGVSVGNEYRDLIYGKFSRSLMLEISQIDKDSTIHKLQTNILVDTKHNIPIIEGSKFSEIKSDKSISIKYDLQKNEGSRFSNQKDGLEYDCEFNGILLAKHSTGKYPSLISPDLVLNVDFIGALREKAKLDYRLREDTEKSGIDGTFLYDFLIRDYLTTNKLFFNGISKWLSEKFEGWSLDIDVDTEPYHIRLKRGDLDVDLTETGMGISQSLPLIVRAFRECQQSTLIVLEEPEAHLHPYAHSELAQLFAESIKKDKKKKYLIETHSQNFVLRLRRLIAEGILDISDLAIYYVDFHEEKNESSLSNITVDKTGGVGWWPEGIFSETNIETRAIYKAQISDSGYVGRDT